MSNAAVTMTRATIAMSILIVIDWLCYNEILYFAKQMHSFGANTVQHPHPNLGVGGLILAKHM
jgi:hypothetical protein